MSARLVVSDRGLEAQVLLRRLDVTLVPAGDDRLRTSRRKAFSGFMAALRRRTGAVSGRLGRSGARVRAVRRVSVRASRCRRISRARRGFPRGCAMEVP